MKKPGAPRLALFETWANAKEMQNGKGLLPIERLNTKSTDDED